MLKTNPARSLIILLGLFLLAGAGYWADVLHRSNQPIEVVTYPSPSPSPVPTPSATPEPVPATRLGYVQQQLVAAGFDVTVVQQLVNDTRLKLYPARQVAYKPPIWKLVENKLYAATFVQRGKDYIKTNQKVFDQAQTKYGVPKEVIASIIAIETEFDKNSGTAPVFNSLYSRMEQWPVDQWKSQAAQLIALGKYCLSSHQDCFAIKGSYAGALGLVQFMPDSVISYGVDGNNDGKIDLYDPVDAVPSASNFLIGHGWNNDQLKALAGYYGSSVGYPGIVLHYASLLAK